ncbi:MULTISPECIES: caspase family protein [Deefgea]|nr:MULTISPECIES: caspase family protein [Deefgea]MBM9888814.1 caspase family protein [Deefgea sp. CFH1-16]
MTAFKQLVNYAIWLALLWIASQPTYAAGRYALLIGNAAYDQPLVNPVNDARAMASQLQQLGFDVTLQTDLKRDALLQQVGQFAQRAQGAELALVFYAGHGAQGGDSNYLVPVDLPTRTLSRQSLQRGGYDVNQLLGELQRNHVQAGVLMIDACRVVYQRGDTPDLSLQGLKAASAPKGYVLAYSTSPGGRASDYWSRESKNSPYTYAMLNELAKPAQPLETLLKNVGNRVATLTQHTQIPWYSSSLTGNALQLNPGKTLASSTSTAKITTGGSRGSAVWDSVKLYDWVIEIRQQKLDPYLDRKALKNRANAGDVVAQTGWAMLNQPAAERKKWLERAAAQQFPLAQMYLGEWYLDNERNAAGRQQAEVWLNKAAEFYPPARATLADLYLQQGNRSGADIALKELGGSAMGYINQLKNKSGPPAITR